MTKTDILMYCVALLWGIILSVFYFGGLYYTLKLTAGSNKLKSILFISFIIRTIVVLAGFWITVKYGFQKAVIAGKDRNGEKAINQDDFVTNFGSFLQ